MLTDIAVKATFVACPRNDSLPPVLQKVAVLNSLYHAGILDLYRMAEHIVSSRVDTFLAKEDYRAVDRIRRGHGIAAPGGRDRDFYSFATKYCHWHRPDAYPTYDSYVVMALRSLGSNYRQSASFSEADLLDFSRFTRVIDRLRSRLDHSWSYKKLDQALWTLGHRLKK